MCAYTDTVYTCIYYVHERTSYMRSYVSLFQKQMQYHAVRLDRCASGHTSRRCDFLQDHAQSRTGSTVGTLQTLHRRMCRSCKSRCKQCEFTRQLWLEKLQLCKLFENSWTQGKILKRARVFGSPVFMDGFSQLMILRVFRLVRFMTWDFRRYGWFL